MNQPIDTTPDLRRRQHGWLWRGQRATTWLLTALLGSILLGCGDPTADQATGSAAAPTANPQGPAAKLLIDAFAGYATASRYADEARLVLSYRQGTEEVIDETRFSTKLVRPNRFAFHLQRGNNQLQLTGDGSSLWAEVDDPQTSELRDQLVRRPLPETLAVGEFYAATELLNPAQPYQMISLLLALPLNLQLSQLGWLCGDPACSRLVAAAQSIEEISSEPWQGRDCRRIAVTTATGVYRFWLDPQSLRIRRVEYPTNELFQNRPADERPRDVHLDLEINDVSGTASLEFAAPAVGERAELQYFVLPPVPLPHPRLGQQLAPFDFRTLDSARESSATWSGRRVVLVWINDQVESRTLLARLSSLPELQAARAAASPADPLVRIVYVDPDLAAAEDHARKLQSTWPCDFPLVLDDQAQGRETLQIDAAPTLVVLDGDHRLQTFEVGVNPGVPTTLPRLLERLQDGTNVGGELRAAADGERQRYEQQLRVARLDAPPAETSAETAATDLAAAAPFRKFTARQVWEFRGAQQPGFLTVLQDARGEFTELAVLNGMSEVVLLDRLGQELRRHDLPLETGSFVAQLRYFRTRQGQNYFAGFTQLGRFAYLLDHDFRLLHRIPPEQPTHGGMMDLLLEDLDDNGEPEIYVGFASPDGLQRLDGTGRTIWGREATRSVLSIAVQRATQPNHLLVTGEEGVPRPIAVDGQIGEPIPVGQRTIHQLVAAATPARRAQFLGLSYSVEGRLIAVGLDRTLREVWSYGLPAGSYAAQLPPAVWLPIPPDPARSGDELGGFWVLPGPDGSVHLVRDDGELHDQAAWGEELTGIAATLVAGQPQLLISFADHVAAWELLPAPEPTRAE